MFGVGVELSFLADEVGARVVTAYDWLWYSHSQTNYETQDPPDLLGAVIHGYEFGFGR